MSYAWTVAATLLVFGALCQGDKSTQEGGAMALFSGMGLAAALALLWAGKTYL